MADQPYTEADVGLIVEALPRLVASSHGCTPEQCILIEDLEADEWRSVARGVLRALAAAGRLLPEGASQNLVITFSGDNQAFAEQFMNAIRNGPGDWRLITDE